MSETRPDIDNLLGNLAKSFRLKGSLHRQKSAELLAYAAQPESVYIKDDLIAEARQEIARAERWDARESEAVRGYFLAGQEDMNDFPYMQEFGSDMTLCQQQSRCVYETTIQGQQILQGGRDALPV